MMFNFFKDKGSTGNATYESASQSVRKDLKIQRLQQEVDDLKAARSDLIKASKQLLEIKYIAVSALTTLGNQKTSGGPDSLMAEYARDALKKINEVEKSS
jgi:hypothetical protein